MRKKHIDMAERQRTYPVPDLPEDKIDQLVEAGGKYMDSADFNRNSFWNVLVSQIQYLTPCFWIMQAGIVLVVSLLVCRLGYLKVPLYYPFTILAVMTPLLLLLSVREISKSPVYGMWEIEQSSSSQLVKIVACRMVIAGLLDMLFLTGVLAIVSCYYRQSLLQIFLYGMVPFHISSICYLRTITRSSREEMTYHLIMCMLCISVIFSLIMRYPAIFEASMLGGWLFIYITSVILLVKTTYNFLQHEKMLGELLWSLQ